MIARCDRGPAFPAAGYQIVAASVREPQVADRRTNVCCDTPTANSASSGGGQSSYLQYVTQKCDHDRGRTHKPAFLSDPFFHWSLRSQTVRGKETRLRSAFLVEVHVSELFPLIHLPTVCAFTIGLGPETSVIRQYLYCPKGLLLLT